VFPIEFNIGPQYTSKLIIPHRIRMTLRSKRKLTIEAQHADAVFFGLQSAQGIYIDKCKLLSDVKSQFGIESNFGFH
jgi:hypothetical protein